MTKDQLLVAFRKATSIGIERYYDADANRIEKPCAICGDAAMQGVSCYTGEISRDGRALGEKTQYPLCSQHSCEMADDITKIMMGQ